MNFQQAKKFGDKYILLDLVGIGGMAEVYRSKLVRDEGFEKLIVIKKLLPHVAQDKEMVRLFIGEARLAALLQHENIAATYDFGEIDGNYFLAMEYLSGKDLYTFLQRLREINKPLDLQNTLLIISKICEGMDYAHNLRDLKNRNLKIIHRDITPQNIFITYAGKIKIFDFGVAKAEILDNKTQAGVVKGKLSYMSPEQIAGQSIDHRSDIFSIGILLYEMVSGKRMYSGDTAVLIQKCIKADFEELKDIVPNLPSQLYEIVNKALTREVKDRYQSCAEMQTDIDNLMFSMGGRPDSRSLQSFILKLFAREYEEDQKNTIEVMEMSSAAPRLGTGTNIKQAAPEAAGQRTVVQSLDNQPTQQSGIPSNSKPVFQFLTVKQSLITGLLILVVLAVFLVPIFFKRERKTVDSGEVTDNSLKPVHKEVPVTQTAKSSTKDDIDKLQVLAQEALAKNNLISPESDNALKYFSEILAVDPENGLALDGQQKVGDEYVELVQKTLSEKNYSKARKQLAVGMSEFNKKRVLQTYFQRLIREENKAITSLLNKAEEKFLADLLTSPENDCAYKYYSDILELDPENESGQEGIEKIGNRYADIGQKAYLELNIEQAKHNVSLGLLVVPNHNRLNELKAELDNLSGLRMHSTLARKALDNGKIVEALQLADKGLVEYPQNSTLLSLKSQIVRTRDEIIAELSKKARRRLYEKKFTSPVEDSAFTYYSAIDNIHPGNSIAKEGFKTIADRYAALAEEAFRTFELDSAKLYVEQGLKVMPNHTRLLDLKADLTKGKPDAIMKGVMKNIDSLFN